MLNENFVILGILISAVGLTSYFIDTLRGKIQPNRVSFALWVIPPIVTSIAEFKQGVGIQALMPLSIGLFPILILLATFVNKNAYWKLGRLDLSCAVLSLTGLFFWYVTKVGNWAIFFSILADGLAYIPTYAKAYKYPETESAWPWLATASSGLLTILTLKEFSFSNTVFPAYYFLINALLFVVIKFKLGLGK